MHLLKHLLGIAALLSLTACVVRTVQSYAAVDGSSTGDYSNNCVSPYPPSSTVILDRPDVRVRLNIYGIGDDLNFRHAILHAGIVVEPRPGTVAQLLDLKLEVDSPDFAAPLFTDGLHNWVRPANTEGSYEFFFDMPTIPSEISMRFPRLDVHGETVELTSLVLRSERTLQSINLMCQ